MASSQLHFGKFLKKKASICAVHLSLDYTSLFFGIAVKKSLDYGLEDVGGLEHVKKVLHDCVELPIKFPELMKQCPLRLMSNVLLYGPPGTNTLLS